MTTRRLLILTDNHGAQVHETISGAFAVTGIDGERLTSGNFISLEEAAEAALRVVLSAEETQRAGECPECTLDGCADLLCVKQL